LIGTGGFPFVNQRSGCFKLGKIKEWFLPQEEFWLLILVELEKFSLGILKSFTLQRLNPK